MVMLNGQCLCGDVKFRITAPLTHASACHCDQCRQWSGHYWATARTKQNDLVIENGSESIAWYPERHAERGFCVICGSSLFYRQIDAASEHVAVSLGAIKGDTGIELSRHIFVREKGDYYQLPAEAETYEGDDE
ncbi:GFA family protein [Parvularcula marina]|uniref:GFA family protein n=1 Tax=Parvularcula marina TaxID=2292771 RepID=UPI00351837E9